MGEIEMGWGHLTEMSRRRLFGVKRSRTSCLGRAVVSVKLPHFILSPPEQNYRDGRLYRLAAIPEAGAGGLAAAVLGWRRFIVSAYHFL
jgi:hypothetical protein